MQTEDFYPLEPPSLSSSDQEYYSSIFLVFHNPVRNDWTLPIDKGAHEDSKTVLVDDLAALEAEIHPFL